MDEYFPDAGVLDNSFCQKCLQHHQILAQGFSFPSVDTQVQAQHQGRAHRERSGPALIHGAERPVLSSNIVIGSRKMLRNPDVNRPVSFSPVSEFLM